MGSGPSYFRQNKFGTLADQKGYIVIYPSGSNMTDGKCWDVGTKASLTNGGGGDTLSIVSMVKYTLEKYKGDPKKVFVTGSSSGAMMTMTICAVYPEVFAGGAAYSGLPSGCLAGSSRLWSFYRESHVCEWTDEQESGTMGCTGTILRRELQGGVSSYPDMAWDVGLCCQVP